MRVLISLALLWAYLTCILAHPNPPYIKLNATANSVSATDPDWKPGTCQAAIHLRQECIRDFNNLHWVTTWASFTLVDDAGEAIPNLWGRGVDAPYPANEIDVAHIQAPSFAFGWKWYQDQHYDKMTFSYDWGDKFRSEDDDDCTTKKWWSVGHEGIAAEWWQDCVHARVPPGTQRVSYDGDEREERALLTAGG